MGEVLVFGEKGMADVPYGVQFGARYRSGRCGGERKLADYMDPLEQGMKENVVPDRTWYGMHRVHTRRPLKQQRQRLLERHLLFLVIPLQRRPLSRA